MDSSILRPRSSRSSPSESVPRRAADDLEPIRGAGEEGPRISRIGTSNAPLWSRKWIGLLLLGLIVLPWLPIFEPQRGPSSPRLARGVGDLGIVALAFAPDGATIASIQPDGRMALRGAAGEGGTHSFLIHPGPALAMVFSPDGRSLAAGDIGPDVLLHDLGAGAAAHPLGMPIRWV